MSKLSCDDFKAQLDQALLAFVNHYYPVESQLLLSFNKPPGDDLIVDVRNSWLESSFNSLEYKLRNWSTDRMCDADRLIFKLKKSYRDL